MKLKSAKTARKKRTILAVSILGVAALAIGGVIAYSQSRDVFEGKFKLFGYKTLFTETFDAPTNWTTCDTVDKTITVTNKYDEPVAVRIKLEEQWLASDGTTELPLVSATSGYQMAQINLAANSGWTKQGQYYYYDTDLVKNATSTSPITGVTLNCDVNLDTLDPTADGAYSGATYHLKITAQTIAAEGKDTWDTSIAGMVAKKANPDSDVDFTADATVASGNGNGVNRFTENGKDIYYYRGEVTDNNIIWADKCWKILRTTETKGTKIIYYGEPTNVVVDGETVQQCQGYGRSSVMFYQNRWEFTFSDSGHKSSPSDVGYMYGGSYFGGAYYSPGSTSYTFSNGISYGEYNIATLDTSAGQSITGTWAAMREQASARYHYACIDGSTTCSWWNAIYITNFDEDGRFYYGNVGQFGDLDDMKNAIFANNNDSYAKTVVESWFEAENLDGHVSGTRNYEDDLEDAVFCNDRSFYSGSLKGEEDAGSDNNYFAAYGRNNIKDANNKVHPSLACANKNDSFTKTETVTTNGKLRFKVGLLTADELTLAGKGAFNVGETAYLDDVADNWTMTPYAYDGMSASSYSLSSDGSHNPLNNEFVDATIGFHPVVSLSADMEISSGTGLKTDPYIVE